MTFSRGLKSDLSGLSLTAVSEAAADLEKSEEFNSLLTTPFEGASELTASTSDAGLGSACVDAAMLANRGQGDRSHHRANGSQLIRGQRLCKIKKPARLCNAHKYLEDSRQKKSAFGTRNNMESRHGWA